MLSRDMGKIIGGFQPEQGCPEGIGPLRFDAPEGDPARDIEDLISEAVRTVIRAAIFGSLGLVALSLLS
ncbi:MAG: hypothetical protein KKE73_14780 [Proteobacteria bacterium]|nr:hypothetical protein [Pseudomonadota bacterium]